MMIVNTKEKIIGPLPRQISTPKVDLPTCNASHAAHLDLNRDTCYMHLHRGNGK